MAQTTLPAPFHGVGDVRHYGLHGDALRYCPMAFSHFCTATTIYMLTNIRI
ncbi:MAG: hypothetical protein LBG92_04060 [Prevotellaceae bacterium]|jgi:hypothetical protein|nr:hypothetical protein [Prevotellaceae bacterium]